MRSFVELYHALADTTKTSRKVELITQYLSCADEADIGWAVHILRGGKLERAVSSREIREWAAESAGVPLWLLEESYHVVGDLAETTALLVSKSGLSNDSQSDTESLRNWIELLLAMRRSPTEDRKASIQAVWKRLTVLQCLVFNKLMTGGLRIGVSRGIVGKALASVVGGDEALVAHRLMGLDDPAAFSLSALSGVEVAGIDGKASMTPYPFFLAYPLETTLAELGSSSDWCAEWKWDGIRAQIVVRGGRAAVWSRGEELITESFPELAALAERVPDGTVLDGEVVAWDGEGPATFGLLQKRLNRRRVSQKLVSEIPVVFIAYDLLELRAADIRHCSFGERRALLGDIVAASNSATSSLRVSPVIEFSSWMELEDHRARSRELLAEGVMLKRRDSPYGVGRRRGDWWKWKVDPFTVDGVLMYAQKGHGRRADLFTDYTFGVWGADALVPFAKAYSGLTDAEIREVDAFVRSHTREKFGPVRTVEHSLVFEIAFEGIQASSRHKSGIAVPFPRIARWRRDKPASEADTLDTLRALARRQLK